MTGYQLPDEWVRKVEDAYRARIERLLWERDRYIKLVETIAATRGVDAAHNLLEKLIASVEDDDTSSTVEPRPADHDAGRTQENADVGAAHVASLSPVGRAVSHAQVLHLDNYRVSEHAELVARRRASQKKIPRASGRKHSKQELRRRRSIALAIRHHDEDRDDLALAILDKHIAESHGDSGAFGIRGDIHWESGELELAIADYNKAIELDPTDAVHYHSRGVVYNLREDFELAIADYTKAIELDENYAQSYSMRAMTAAKTGDLQMAMADLSKVIELAPMDSEGYIDRGRQHFANKDFELAIADYNKAIKLDPNYSISFYERSDCHFKHGDLGRAAADKQKAINMVPRDFYGYIARVVFFRAVGLREHALRDLLAAARLPLHRQWRDQLVDMTLELVQQSDAAAMVAQQLTGDGAP